MKTTKQAIIEVLALQTVKAELSDMGMLDEMSGLSDELLLDWYVEFTSLVDL